jgi:RNA polymerase sigma-70 factor (ECF subfamily)
MVETQDSQELCMECTLHTLPVPLVGLHTAQSPDGAQHILSNEAALAAQAAESPEAFAALYKLYFPLIYKYVLFRVQQVSDADDLTMNVFERMLASLSRYRPEQAPFGAWLFGLARNVVNDYLRTLYRRRWLPLMSLQQTAASGSSQEEMVEQQELVEALLAALAQLSARERDLISLKFASGLSNRQIANMTGLSESNVGVILYRAMQRLRGLLKEGSHD